MSIKGITNLSLVDWDGVACATVFMGGCNFRCKWCQNAPLVLHPEKLETLEIPNVLQQIEGLGKYIDGICITGGEPTFNKDLIPFIQALKGLNLKVKLDTNGINPDVIAEAVCNVDYIAMDIKAPLTTKKYSQATGQNIEEVDLIRIINSINIIQDFNKKYNFGTDYEFRTTVVPGLHTVKDIEQIAKYAIKGAKKYVIQNFWNAGELIDESYKNTRSFDALELDEFLEAAKPYVNEVKIRDINQKS